jgi:hypothetical protein
MFAQFRSVERSFGTSEPPRLHGDRILFNGQYPRVPWLATPFKKWSQQTCLLCEEGTLLNCGSLFLFGPLALLFSSELPMKDITRVGADGAPPSSQSELGLSEPAN